MDKIDLISNEDFCLKFTEENFLSCLLMPKYFEINDKTQISYLFNYLEKIKCKFILVEDKYIDKYYMDDFIHFYANCYRDYSKFCKRIHFFKTSISEKDFVNLNQMNIKNLRDNYLGFMVVPPLNSIKIGRTLLKIYDDRDSERSNSNIFKGSEICKRQILTLRDYKANIFGINLKIKSIPFREQDATISACATCALWTILEKTGEKFKRATTTPFQIKERAHMYSTTTRPIPSTGMNMEQLITSIRSYGLEVEVAEFQHEDNKKKSSDNFLSMCYAYLRAGLPVFLGINWKKKESETDEANEGYDYHGVALLGYYLNESHLESMSERLRGNRITKLYFHDDNIGPFAKYSVLINNGFLYLTCEERKYESGKKIPIFPYFIIIPIYKKIRFPYLRIQEFLYRFLEYFEFLRVFEKPTYEWDCYLISVNDLKKDLREDSLFQDLSDDIQKKILLGFFPKYIWRCRLIYDNICILELFGDATESQSQVPYFLLFSYATPLSRNLGDILKPVNCKEYLTKEEIDVLNRIALF